jgi:hypothetical protein
LQKGRSRTSPSVPLLSAKGGYIQEREGTWKVKGGSKAGRGGNKRERFILRGECRTTKLK